MHPRIMSIVATLATISGPLAGSVPTEIRPLLILEYVLCGLLAVAAAWEMFWILRAAAKLFVRSLNAVQELPGCFTILLAVILLAMLLSVILRIEGH